MWMWNPAVSDNNYKKITTTLTFLELDTAGWQNHQPGEGFVYHQLKMKLIHQWENVNTMTEVHLMNSLVPTYITQKH